MTKLSPLAPQAAPGTGVAGGLVMSAIGFASGKGDNWGSHHNPRGGAGAGDAVLSLPAAVEDKKSPLKLSRGSASLAEARRKREISWGVRLLLESVQGGEERTRPAGGTRWWQRRRRCWQGLELLENSTRIRRRSCLWISIFLGTGGRGLQKRQRKTPADK